jgi:hypothetical protein
MLPEKGDNAKALNIFSGFDDSQPSSSCLALLTPRVCGAASLMARCATPDVRHPIQLGHRLAEEEVQKNLMKTGGSNEKAGQLALETDRLKLDLENQRRDQRTAERENDDLKDHATQQLTESKQQREISEFQKPETQ